MAHIHNEIQIQRPIEQVFDFVTTPANWPRWHPSSLGVSGAIDHPLDLGEQVVEEFRVAGRRGKAIWTVRERKAPSRWTIVGRVERGGGGTVAYTLRPAGDGTRFQREFDYTLSSPLLTLLDRFVLRHRIAAESAEALRRLKDVLESSERPGASTASHSSFQNQ